MFCLSLFIDWVSLVVPLTLGLSSFLFDKIFDRDKSVHVHQITKGQKSTNDRVEPEFFDIANFTHNGYVYHNIVSTLGFGDCANYKKITLG